MFTLYILQSTKDKNFYIGQTSNLDDRLKRHFQGREKATKNRLPMKLVYKEIYDSRSEVLKREKYLKSLKSHIYIQNLINGSSG